MIISTDSSLVAGMQFNILVIEETCSFLIAGKTKFLKNDHVDGVFGSTVNFFLSSQIMIFNVVFECFQSWFVFDKFMKYLYPQIYFLDR